jgi:predicted DNA-binding helix-hairpin-helix protein
MSKDLSKRAVAALQVALKKRTVTPAAVAKLDYIRVLVQPGIGTKTMNEIEVWLARHGLTFRRPRRQLAVILREIQSQDSAARRT